MTSSAAIAVLACLQLLATSGESRSFVSSGRKASI